MTDRILLKPREVAEQLSVSAKTVYRLMDQGEIRRVKVGHSWRVPVAAVTDYIRRLEKRVA